MLDIRELLEIEEVIREELDDNLEEILIRLNRTGQLEELLSLLGMERLLGFDDEYIRRKDGIIIVIGQSEVDREKLTAVAKSMGICKNRLEFCLDYETVEKFNFKKTQWSPKYSCILVGPMPHSGCAKEDYGSIISALENKEGYPPVIRVGSDELKITKTSFRNSLEYLADNGLIA